MYTYSVFKLSNSNTDSMIYIDKSLWNEGTEPTDQNVHSVFHLERWTHILRTWRQCSGCNICQVFVLDSIKRCYFLVFCVRELWHLYRNTSVCYTTLYSGVVPSSVVNQREVWWGSMPVKMKAVIKSMMYHCRYKHSNYLDSKGFHYSYSEVGCFSSAYANSLALMQGFSNGWSICHDKASCCL